MGVPWAALTGLNISIIGCDTETGTQFVCDLLLEFQQGSGSGGTNTEQLTGEPEGDRSALYPGTSRLCRSSEDGGRHLNVCRHAYGTVLFYFLFKIGNMFKCHLINFSSYLQAE